MLANENSSRNNVGNYDDLLDLFTVDRIGMIVYVLIFRSVLSANSG
jgi:hypothetical protein